MFFEDDTSWVLSSLCASQLIPWANFESKVLYTFMVKFLFPHDPKLHDIFDPFESRSYIVNQSVCSCILCADISVWIGIGIVLQYKYELSISNYEGPCTWSLKYEQYKLTKKVQIYAKREYMTNFVHKIKVILNA